MALIKRLSKRSVLKALEAHDGVISAAARSLGFSRQAVWEFIKRHKLQAELERAREAQREVRVEVAEAVIDKLLAKDHFSAAALVLRSHSEHWRDRAEVEHKGKIDMVIDRPPAPASVDDWLKVKDRVLAGRKAVLENA